MAKLDEVLESTLAIIDVRVTLGLWIRVRVTGFGFYFYVVFRSCRFFRPIIFPLLLFSLVL